MQNGGHEADIRSSIERLMPLPEAHEQPLTIPLADAMDWKSVTTGCKSGSGEATFKYYVIVFRSIRSKDADHEKLYSADALAYAEAIKSGGLLRYWYGIINERRENLAMCIWESRNQALGALHLPAHRLAAELAPEMYEAYVIERYWLTLGTDGEHPIIEPLTPLPPGHGLSRPASQRPSEP